MKYIGDTMLNGLEKYMVAAGIDFVTATYAIGGDRNTSIEIPDGRIFRHVLEKKYKLILREDAEDCTIITSDKELPKYCQAFGISCISVKKPDTRAGFKDVAAKLADQLKPK